jgi:hypothetical protein
VGQLLTKIPEFVVLEFLKGLIMRDKLLEPIPPAIQDLVLLLRRQLRLVFDPKVAAFGGDQVFGDGHGVDHLGLLGWLAGLGLAVALFYADFLLDVA